MFVLLFFHVYSVSCLYLVLHCIRVLIIIACFEFPFAVFVLSLSLCLSFPIVASNGGLMVHDARQSEQTYG